MAGESFEGKKKKKVLCDCVSIRREEAKTEKVLKSKRQTKQRNRELRGRKTGYKNEEGNEEIISRKAGGKKKQE